MRAKDAVSRARRSLKSSDPSIYINEPEDLTKFTADLYRNGKLLVKNKLLYAAWTAGGAVEASCTLRKVTTEAALQAV